MMRYAYFPGCSLHSTAADYDRSARAVCGRLGIELAEIPDWNCCGASSAHMTDERLALALPARNLAAAEKEGLDVVAPCAACFNRLKITWHEVRHGEAAKLLADLGIEYTGRSGVKSLLEVIARDYGAEKLAGQVVRSLEGLKVACYYGCLLVRPQEIMDFDDVENPTVMDGLMEALGAEPVPWSHKTECCGASLALSRSDLVASLVGRILAAAKEAGADALVTACPLCQANLDMRQREAARAAGEDFNLPVYYFTDLVGLALGLGPAELDLGKKMVDAVGPLRARELA